MASPTTAHSDDERQTVLLVGSGDPMEAALSLALGRYGLAVENSPMKDAMQAVFVHAPDLAVLLGDAAKEEGGEVLADLAGRASTAVVPVALLSDDPDLERRLRAFRYGAVAVVPRSPSADEMARRIADIVHELPERDKTTGADLGETTLDELVRLVSTRLRSGILSVRAQGQSEGARIVLRGGQPVTEAIEQLVASIRPLIASPSGALAFEFEEQPTGRLAAIADAEVAPPGEIDVRGVLAGRRFVLVERSPTRADDLVQALRGLGAFVAVVDGEGQGMEKARAIAPEIVVVDARGIGGWASPALRTIRHDLRLRWAALLVARADEIWPEGAPGADLSRLAAGVQPLIEADLSLTARAKTEEKFSARIESTGAERFIRALLESGQTLHVRVQHPRAVVDLDLAEGLVVGVIAKGAREMPGRSAFPGKPVEASGVAALAVLLGLASGRAQIERKNAPSIANVMSPLDDAIAAADREAPPIRPSLPPPSTPPSSAPSGTERPMFPNALLNDPPELLRQLESLLIDLRQSIPPSGGDASILRGASVAGAFPVSTEVPRAKTLPAMPKPITGLPRAPLPAVPRPGVIPAPAPVPSLAGVRKKTLVGVMAPVAPAPPDVSAPEISVPAIPIPPSPPAPPGADVASDPESLANLLEPESSEIEIAGAYPAAIPPIAPPSVPPTALPPMPAPPMYAPPMYAPPMPVVTDTGALAPPSAKSSGAMAAVPSPLPPAPDDLDDLVVRRSRRKGLWIGLVVLLFLGAGVGGGAWFFLAGGGVSFASITSSGATSTVGTAPVGTGPTGTAPTDIATVAAGASDAGASAEPPDGGARDAGIVDAGSLAARDAGELELLADGEEERTDDSGELGAEDTSEGAVDAALLGVTERRARIEYLIDRANFRRRHGEPAGAATDYEAVLRVESTNARALAGLARLNLDRGHGSEAVGYARRLTRSHPSQPANFVLLGDCLLAAGDRGAAIRAFQDALRLSPSYRTARERIAGLPPR
jgi:DNA-binding response OmpR family regulator